MNNEATPNVEAEGNGEAGFWAGFEILHVVTRADLLGCGDLIDASQAARRVGFTLPLAVSVAAWSTVAAKDADERDAALFHMLMLAKAAATSMQGGNVAPFDYEGTGLYLHIGPGDCPAPVLTIMVQGED